MNPENAPYEISLELIRGEHSDDPFELPEGQRTYLWSDQGKVLRSVLSWNKQLEADLYTLTSERPDPAAVQRLGDILRRFVVPFGWRAHEAAIRAAVESSQAVSINLRFAASELYLLPWDLLTLEDSGAALGTLPGVSIRYAWPGAAPPATALRSQPERGRILFAWSAAGGAVPAVAHLRALRQACSRGDYPFEPDRDVLAHASLSMLADTLRQSEAPVAALHVLCHGGTRGETTGLWLNTSDNTSGAELVDPSTFANLLGPYANRLRLVVLSTCRGGDSGPLGSHLGSMAQMLHRRGIHAVIAPRFLLSADRIDGEAVVTRGRARGNTAPPEGGNDPVGLGFASALLPCERYAVSPICFSPLSRTARVRGAAQSLLLRPRCAT